MELENRKKLERLEEFRKTLVLGEKETIKDIKIYGEVDFTNDFINNPEEIFVVIKEKEGQIYHEFYANTEKMGEVNEQGIIVLNDKFQKIVDNGKILSELQNRIPTSLKNLEKLLDKENHKENLKVPDSEQENTNETKKTKPLGADIELDLDKRITQKESIKDFIPQIRRKRI